MTSYSPNLEVWGAEQFGRLCPGKQAHVGYDEWLRRTADAVGVLGRGNVYTQLVGGAELAGEDAVPSVDDALARIEELDALGCQPFAQPYRDFTGGTKPSREAWRLAYWCNNKRLFNAMDFADYTCK